MKNNKSDFVQLRSRKRASGVSALYLDIRIDGMRRQEFLNLHLVPEITREDRVANKETMRQAEAIRAKRLVDMQARRFDIEPCKGTDKRFFDVVESLISRKEGTTKTSWQNCMAHLLVYEPDRSITLGKITPKWVRGFRDYLDKKACQWDIDSRKRDVKPRPLSEGTKALMFQKLCCVLNVAFKEGLLDRNPTLNVERFKEPESEREFLTVEELKKLTKTPPPDKVVGRAFLFSCLTGLRWSDIARLTWREVQSMGSHLRLVFKQKKTGSLQYLDISSQASSLLGERGEDDTLVFDKLTTAQSARIMVSAWVKAAGIDKHITFHCGRHTFAVTLLDQGVDLYTLSKLLGHKSIETTQIYARILDRKKQEAINVIPNIFGE